MNYAMRMLANRHTRRLFGATAGAVVLFTVAAAAAASLRQGAFDVVFPGGRK